MKKKHTPTSEPFLTEEMLKEQARRRAEQQRLQEQALHKSPARRKWENYWYHYKWHTLAGVVAVLFLALFAKDVFFATKPDLTVVAVTTGTYLSAEDADALVQVLEAQMTDWNGDGNIMVLVDSLNLGPMDDDAPFTQESYANSMKLAAVFSAASDPLYLLDDGALAHITRDPSAEDGQVSASLPVSDIFAPLDGIPGADGAALPVAHTVLAGTELGERLAGMSFYLRNPAAFEKQADYYANCRALLQQLAA